MRAKLGLGLAILAGLAVPASLHASFHEVKIVQVFGGTALHPDASYVMLQMWAAGQNLVGGHSLTVYNGDGTLAGTLTFPDPPGGNLANGANQATFLIGTAEAETVFGVSMDLVISSVSTTGQGAKICWSGDGTGFTPDCVALGGYTGPSDGVGAPFRMGDIVNRALSRRLDICTGPGTSPTALDSCDDTDVSAADFVLTLPSPKNNAGDSGTLPASTCGNHVLEGLEDCDDGNTADGDGCSSKCTIEASAGGAAALRVDTTTGTSDGDGVFEPGETVTVVPSWKNTSGSSTEIAGAATAFTGPSGASYEVVGGLADYGDLDAGATHDCTSSGFCYQLKIGLPFARPNARPATHWDATFEERLLGPASKTWTLHVGDSFTDVPRSEPFYKRIETLLHTGITAGCTATTYCPADPVSRGAMAIFIAKGLAGGGPNVPASGTVGASPYNCVAGGAGVSLFPDVLPTDSFCKHVHYIAARNVTAGCAGGGYCPNDTVTRIQMASFIAKALVAPAGGPGVPATYGPDPVTGFSYSCDAGSPSIHFTDVPPTDPFCKHVHYLWAKGIITGCGATTYCPGDPVTRDAMAKFLTTAFHLALYGP